MPDPTRQQFDQAVKLVTENPNTPDGLSQDQFYALVDKQLEDIQHNAPMTLRGFGQNVVSSAGSAVSALPKLAMKAVSQNPVDTISDVAHGLVNRAGQYAEHPIRTAYEDPVGVALDAAGAYTAGKGAVTAARGVRGAVNRRLAPGNMPSEPVKTTFQGPRPDAWPREAEVVDFLKEQQRGSAAPLKGGETAQIPILKQPKQPPLVKYSPEEAEAVNAKSRVPTQPMGKAATDIVERRVRPGKPPAGIDERRIQELLNTKFGGTSSNVAEDAGRHPEIVADSIIDRLRNAGVETVNDELYGKDPQIPVDRDVETNRLVNDFHAEELSKRDLDSLLDEMRTLQDQWDEWSNSAPNPKGEHEANLASERIEDIARDITKRGEAGDARAKAIADSFQDGDRGPFNSGYKTGANDRVAGAENELLDRMQRGEATPNEVVEEMNAPYRQANEVLRNTGDIQAAGDMKQSELERLGYDEDMPVQDDPGASPAEQVFMNIDPETQPRTWHSGAKPGSPEAKRASQLHAGEDEMHNDFTRRMADDRGSATLGFLGGAAAEYIMQKLGVNGVTKKVAKAGAGYVPGLVNNRITRGAAKSGLVGRFAQYADDFDDEDQEP